MSFTGGCRCGAIRYTCEAEPAMVVHCYCRDCQYASGGACTTAVVTLADSLAIEGTPKAYTTIADSGTQVSRLFCETCGTPVFAKNASMPFMAIKAATLDEPRVLQPGANIWTQSAPPWARVAHDLPSYPRNLGES